MRTHLTRPWMIVAAAAALALFVTSCAAVSPEGEVPGGDSVNSDSAVSTPTTPSEDDGDAYAFGTDRDQMAEAIEAAFSTKNGKARWDGNTLVLAVEGDANEEMAGFSECRVLLMLLHEDDESAIQFPNGQVDCAEVLSEEE